VRGGGDVTFVQDVLVRRSQHTDGRAVTLPIFIIDLPIYVLNDLWRIPLGSGIVWRVSNYSKCNKLWKSLVMSGNSKGMKYDNEVVEENRLECRRLIEQRKTFYEDYLRKINDELGSDGTEVKMDVMYSMF